MQENINIWFQGGGYACLWSFGVAQAFKENNIKFNCVGGYSAGALMAAFICNKTVDSKKVLDSAFDSPYGPNKGIFSLIGKHERNLMYMAEACVGNPLDWNNGENFNNKIWIPIRGLKTINGSWRKKYRSYDDIIDCIVSTACIPGISGELSKCYYEDTGDKRDITIDGGIFSLNYPKEWINKTIVVSPWGTGDLNMNPRAKFLDVALINKNKLNIYYNLGLQQGKEFLIKNHMLLNL